MGRFHQECRLDCLFFSFIREVFDLSTYDDHMIASTSLKLVRGHSVSLFKRLNAWAWLRGFVNRPRAKMCLCLLLHSIMLVSMNSADLVALDESYSHIV